MSAAIVGRRLADYARLVRLEKPVGWLLLLWPTLWALWLADATPDPADVALFVAGAFFTRSLGCCLNDIADRRLDAQVERTRNRPLAAGRISVAEAWLIAAAMLACCFGLWLLLASPARIWALAALAVAATYPLAKRFTHLPQLHLGVAFSCGIPIAFAHAAGSVPASAWLLVAANCFYVLAYDTIYAMVDLEDDLAAGNRSSAILFGDRAVFAVACCYFLLLALMIAHGTAVGAPLAFYLACGLGFGMAGKYVGMIRSRDRRRCLLAFRLNHWLGALLFAGIALPPLSSG